MERADALAEERAALTNYMRNTLITNELKFKEVRYLHVYSLFGCCSNSQHPDCLSCYQPAGSSLHVQTKQPATTSTSITTYGDASRRIVGVTYVCLLVCS